MYKLKVCGNLFTCLSLQKLSAPCAIVPHVPPGRTCSPPAISNAEFSQRPLGAEKTRPWYVFVWAKASDKSSMKGVREIMLIESASCFAWQGSLPCTAKVNEKYHVRHVLLGLGFGTVRKRSHKPTPMGPEIVATLVLRSFARTHASQRESPTTVLKQNQERPSVEKRMGDHEN